MYRSLLIIIGFVFLGDLVAQDTLELNWTLVYEDEDAPGNLLIAEATVPGAIQLDIAKNEGYGPYYYGENWKDYLWMEDREFVYVSNFVKPSMKDGERLVFRSLGIDYEFEIIFNGKKLLSQEGMFTRNRPIAIRQQLRSNQQSLTVGTGIPAWFQVVYGMIHGWRYFPNHTLMKYQCSIP